MARELLTLGEYAKRLGVFENAIQDRLASGAITEAALHREGNKVYIDPVQANLDFEFLGDADRAFETSLLKDDDEDTDKDDADTDEGLSALDQARKNAALFKKAKIHTEEIRARKLELEIQIKEQTLLDSREVKKRIIKVISEVRDGILNVPGRVAPELVAMTSSLDIEKKLYEELCQALTSLARLEGPSDAQ